MKPSQRLTNGVNLLVASPAVQKAASVANETFGRGRVLAMRRMAMHAMLLAVKSLDISLGLIYHFTPHQMLCFFFFFLARAIIGGGFSWRSLLVNFKMFHFVFSLNHTKRAVWNDAIKIQCVGGYEAGHMD